MSSGILDPDSILFYRLLTRRLSRIPSFSQLTPTLKILFSLSPQRSPGFFCLCLYSKYSPQPKCYYSNYWEFFYFLATPAGMRDLSSLTRDQTHTPYLGSTSLNHWTAKEVPILTTNPQNFIHSSHFNSM